MQNKKNVSIQALPELGGGGLPLPEFFCALFLLKEKVSPMVATREESVKLPELGGGGGLANSGNARIETFFFALHSSLSVKTLLQGKIFLQTFLNLQQKLLSIKKCN